MLKIVLLLYCALLPAVAFAQSDGAAFASQSVFLSHSSINEGDSITAYANILNTSTALFEGKVVFMDNDTIIGSQSLSLPEGQMQVVEMSWQPAAGSHKVQARLENSGLQSIAQSSASLQVAAPLNSISDDNSTTTVEASTPIAHTISHFSPAVGNIVAPVLSFTDSSRQKTVDVLDRQIAKTVPKLPGIISHRDILAKAPPPQDWKAWIFSLLWTLYFYLLTILRYILSNLAFFYAVSIILTIYILYRMVRLFG